MATQHNLTLTTHLAMNQLSEGAGVTSTNALCDLNSVYVHTNHLKSFVFNLLHLCSED